MRRVNWCAVFGLVFLLWIGAGLLRGVLHRPYRDEAACRRGAWRACWGPAPADGERERRRTWCGWA